VDPKPVHNVPVAHGFLQRAAQHAGAGRCAVDEATSVGEGLERLTAAQRTGSPYDLVISHWGADRKPPTAVRLLTHMRTEDLRAPVLIFSKRSRNWEQRRKQVLDLGAQGYFFSWEGLLRGIEWVLAPGVETG
jgi:DNA-binding response OmpR family regulator